MAFPPKDRLRVTFDVVLRKALSWNAGAGYVPGCRLNGRRSRVRIAMTLALCCALSALGCDRAAKPLAVSQEQFRSLRWLEGRWRGREAGHPFFYEDYRVVDDSTIATRSLSDSTFTAASDSSRLELRGHTLSSGGGSSEWIATELDGTHVHFEPRKGARNNFTLRYVSPTRWSAVLRWPKAHGRPAREVIYQMERLAP